MLLRYGWRVLLATALLAVASYGCVVLMFQSGVLRPAVVRPGLLTSLIVLKEALTVGVLTWPTVRSRWSGTQLACALFVAYFGLHSFVTVSRGILMAPAVLTPAVAVVVVAQGFLLALVTAFVMVVVMGRMHHEPFVAESPRLHLPPGEWAWKLIACAAAGVAFFLAGYFSLSGSVRQFYQGAGQPSMGERLILETGRALLVVAFLLPVVKMLRGGRLEAALTVGLMAAVLGGATPLILPTDLVPGDVRASFIVTNTLFNFAHGILVGYLFSRRPGIDSPAGRRRGRFGAGPGFSV